MSRAKTRHRISLSVNQLDRFVTGAAAFTRLAHLRSLSSISSMARAVATLQF